MILGRIDEVDGHFVATRFLAGALPLETFYVSEVGKLTHAGANPMIRIRTDWRSVGLGYARVWAPVLALALPIAGVAAGGAVVFASLVVSAVLIAAAVLAHKSGRLGEEEKARLRLLGTVTGLRIDPARLEPHTREIKRDLLGGLMEKGGIPILPYEILSVLEDIPAPALPLVYGYACYSGDDGEWRDCALRLYEKHKSNEI